MNRETPTATLTRTLTVVACLLATSASAQAGSVLSGAYSEAQAVRGQTLYYQHCLQCHGETMAGVDQAPPLTGPKFSGNWSGESLWSLVERLNTMPPEKPGTLSRQEAVDTLTYVLWYNGLPLGDEPLSTDKDVLTGLTFETPPLGK